MLRRFVEEAVDGGDPSVVKELFAPDVVAEMPGSPEPVVGVDAYLAGVEALLRAFPDMHAEIVDLAAEERRGGDGHVAIAYLRASGTNTGELFGLPATGLPARWTTVHTWHVESGRVVRDKVLADFLGMFTQLGLVTPPTPPAPPG